MTRFRTGRLLTCTCFLEAVPRSEMIRALVAHCTGEHPVSEGQAVRTEYRSGDHRFHIETAADRQSTAIRLG